MAIPKKNLKRVLVVRNDRFGEFLLNIPVFRALKETYPSVGITLVADPSVSDLVHKIPYVDEVLYWKRTRHFIWEKAAFLFQLRRRKFDAAVILNPTKAMNIFTFLAGIPVRAGYKRKWDFLLTVTMEDTKGAGLKHEVEANLELAGLLGAATGNKSICLSGIDANMGRDLIAIHPFTSDEIKQWPIERFERLALELAAAGGRRIVIVGKPESARDRFTASDPNIIDLIGKTSLPQLAELLSRCVVLISCDSGPVHLACCMNTPVVALFRNDIRGKNPERWGPWGSGHTVLQKSNLKDISIGEVKDTVDEIVARAQAAKRRETYSCDIVIAVYNQLDYTRQCIDSIRSNTTCSHRIIVVDDSSGEETSLYLLEMARRGVIELLRNETNLGWVESVNKGIRYSSAEFVCVMNNDIEVYPGWLEEMLHVALRDPAVGIVNPVWEIPKYFRGGRQDFYKRHIGRQVNRSVETDWARGFCFLIRRAVIDSVGYLDPAFSPGYYDDWDYSVRAVKAGFTIERALGAFVWHYKNISYKKKLGADSFNRILEEKEKIFIKRWGVPLRLLVLSEDPGAVAEEQLRRLILLLLRDQNKLTVVHACKRLSLNHTNGKFRYSRPWAVVFATCTLLLNNLRFGKSKRYNIIICSDGLKDLVERFRPMRWGFTVFPLQEAVNDENKLFEQLRALKLHGDDGRQW